MKRILIVGAGFSGATAARVLAERGHLVFLIDQRDHLGGNAHDCYDEHGVLIHPYGPHLFHTNSQVVFDFLSKFTEWLPYEHRVLAKVGDKLLPIPINRTTLNRLYNLELETDAEAEAYYESVREKIKILKTSEDVVLASVGMDLCDKFFSGYTKKQWGLTLSQLSAGVAARIPTRTNDDDRYFSDRFQVMPKAGYHQLFNKLVRHDSIKIFLSTSYSPKLRMDLGTDHLIYCGPIDEFYNYCFGKLPYRSLRFEHQYFSNIDSYQEVGTVNFPNDFLYTRITEFKKITQQSTVGTSIVREYPTDDGPPFYPIPRPENQALYKKYDEKAASELDVTFLGRLAEYQYYNMDQAVARALKVASELEL